MALSILSSLNEIYRRDVAVSSVNLVTPTHADCLVAGEFVKLNSSGEVVAPDGDATDTTLYQLFTEKGDYSAQALSKVTILNSFDYIAETDQTSATITAGNFLMVDAAGQLLPCTTGKIAVAVALSSGASGATVKIQRISPMLHD